MTTPHGYPEPEGPLTLSQMLSGSRRRVERGVAPVMTTPHGYPEPEGPLTLSQIR